MGNSNSGGHNALPKHLKIVRGTYRPGREKEVLPGQALKILPPPPKGMSESAKKVYKVDGQRLIDSGILISLFLSMFEMYCYHKGTENQIIEQLSKEGLMIPGPRGGLKVNPLDKVLKQYSKLSLEIGLQFGLTPVSRSRIHTGPQENKALSEV